MYVRDEIKIILYQFFNEKMRSDTNSQWSKKLPINLQPVDMVCKWEIEDRLLQPGGWNEVTEETTKLFFKIAAVILL